MLTWEVDKSRLDRLRHDECTLEFFSYVLSGAPCSVPGTLRLDNASGLASSLCYLLPTNPFSDNATTFGDLEDPMRTLGFKDCRSEGIWKLLSALLTLVDILFEVPLRVKKHAAPEDTFARLVSLALPL